MNLFNQIKIKFPYMKSVSSEILLDMLTLQIVSWANV